MPSPLRLCRITFFSFAASALCYPQSSIQQHELRARAAQARQDFAAAAVEWKQIAALAPNLAEAHANLGMMYYFDRKPAQAIRPFLDAIRLAPKLVGPHIFLGVCYYLVSRPQEAISPLERALQLEPENALARRWLGLSYVYAGRTADGIVLIEQVRAADRSDADILFQLSRAYSRLATDCLLKIRESWPDSPWDHLVRADQYRLQGRTQEADRHSKQAVASPPKLVGYTAAAQDWKRTGDTPGALYTLAAAARVEALARVEEFARLEPGSYRVHQLRAAFEEARGDLEAAEAEHRKALALKPNALHVHAALGNLFLERKDFEKAIAEYESELKIDPYSTLALTQAGVASRYLQRHQEAIGYLKRSLAIDDHSSVAHKEIGIAYLNSQNAAAAIGHLERARTLTNGGDDAVYFQLSRAYRAAGQPARAAEYQEMLKQRLQQKRERLSATAP